MNHLLRALVTAAFTTAIPAMSIGATTEIYDYAVATSSTDISILGFESGSTGFSTPNDIAVSAYGATTAAGWHGQGTLDYFVENNIPENEFGQQFLGNVSAYPRHTDISAQFLKPVNFAGAWLMWSGDLESIKTIEFSVYGTNDELLYSKELAAPQYFDQIYFFGVHTDQTIKTIVWHPIEDSFFRLDNLSYVNISSPIPEPSTDALLILGLIGLRIVSKRRSSCSQRPLLRAPA